ncbi:hypothetical protein C4D60_Mb06t09100 [Musa balbisiana]|uniref:Chalcone/stilbene synthase C-terminal domain-containing protein n=1 Tax=Musa balbisiana TaxID=52838 RepID=A0A4S8ILN6_MUSBA|nr:hypothetical protein C4D60_Mb06t09100 [Musa balbisiana]
MTEYGNMSSACVLFILDEMRKRSAEDGKATTARGWSGECSTGSVPGLTVETWSCTASPSLPVDSRMATPLIHASLCHCQLDGLLVVILLL